MGVRRWSRRWVRVQRRKSQEDKPCSSLSWASRRLCSSKWQKQGFFGELAGKASTFNLQEAFLHLICRKHLFWGPSVYSAAQMCFRSVLRSQWICLEWTALFQMPQDPKARNLRTLGPRYPVQQWKAEQGWWDKNRVSWISCWDGQGLRTPCISTFNEKWGSQETTCFKILKACFFGLPCGSVGKESNCKAGDLGVIPGLGRSPGGRHGNPLQYSCLENPMDRGAWQATVHRVTKNQTWLRDSAQHSTAQHLFL